jgi:LDH2 family malate/lactate/ureidoglycolate dehydrogenase
MKLNKKDRNVDEKTLRSFCSDCLEALGATREDAKTISTVMIEADMRGIESQGIIRLPTYVNRVKAGALNPKPNIRIIKKSSTTALLDGDAGFGHVLGVKAMKMAIDKAKDMGIGIVAVRNGSHLGAMAFYSMLALPHDMIGFATTNGAAVMPAWGGASRAIGNNPVCYAIPTDYEFPIVLDMAQSVVGLGKLRVAAKKGEKIPINWATDAQGNPTDDPNEGLKGGALLPIGGPKGYGLSVVMDVLCGVLTGSLFGKDCAHKEDLRPEGCGHFFEAINIESFMPAKEFKERVNSLIKQLKGSEKASNVKEILLPGEIEGRMKKERERAGIPIPWQIYIDLVKVAEEFSMEIPF